MRNKIGNKVDNQKGEAMLMTTILLLVLVVIVGACANIADMQWDMAYLQRKTSNTYYLAKSGAEKGVDLVNKAIQAQMPDVIEHIRQDYLEPITDRDAVRGANDTTDDFYSSRSIAYNGKKFFIDESELSNRVSGLVYEFVEANYLGKKIEYEVKGDGQEDTVTHLEINFLENSPGDKTSFKVICKASVGPSTNPTHHPIDVKEVEALVAIEMPSEIDNEIDEAYNWLYHPAEIVDSALTCFSDVVITKGAQLTVKGDIRVRGTAKETATEAVGGGQVVLKVPDVNEIGGIIASNGGRLTVKSMRSTASTRPGTSYLSSKNNMIMSNRKKFLVGASVASQQTGTDNYSTNTGSIYCVNNVVTTNGWETEGSQTKLENYKSDCKSIISVEGDIIANTVAICDDFYGEGANQTPYDGLPGEQRLVNSNEITVGKNIFVENDVSITRYVMGSHITVEGSIFGISDGALAPSYNLMLKRSDDTTYTLVAKDPNSSSGIFNEGSGGSCITADGMFVNGQPFIDFGNGGFYKVYESIGEPYKNMRNFYGAPDNTFTPSDDYLDTTGVFKDEIKKEQIRIKAQDKTYVPEDTKISAMFGPTTTVGSIKEGSNSYISNKDQAIAFFYKGAGWKGWTVPLLYNHSVTEKDNDYDKSGYFISPESYYVGDKTLFGEDIQGLYFKKYADSALEDYKGLRGYMLSKRSVFYGRTNTIKPQLLEFSDVIGQLSVDADWNYSTPIEVVDGGTIDISNYYVNEGGVSSCYPTIIINKSGDLTIEAGDNNKNYFKGLIISEGNVTIKGKVILEGALIIGGKHQEDRKKLMLGDGVGLKLSGGETKVELIHNPDIIFQMTMSDKLLFREILDALKITQFKGNEDVFTILGPYNRAPYNAAKPITYTIGRVKLSAHSVLNMTTKHIKVKIKTIKKLNG